MHVKNQAKVNKVLKTVVLNFVYTTTGILCSLNLTERETLTSYR